MQEITVLKGDSPIKALFWDNNSDETIVVVGGSGDDKGVYIPIINRLVALGLSKNIFSFSFTGSEEERFLPLSMQSADLKSVLSWIETNLKTKVILVPTSMGAYSACSVMIDPKFNKYIKSTFFVDPADYYLSDMNSTEEIFAWSGYKEYLPETETGSGLLRNGIGNVIAHVINFVLVSYSNTGFVSPENKDFDKLAKYPRLNNDMVKSFYLNTPKKNRGQYIEDNKIPHAFMRDGNIEEHVENLSKLLLPLLEAK